MELPLVEPNYPPFNPAMSLAQQINHIGNRDPRIFARLVRSYIRHNERVLHNYENLFNTLSQRSSWTIQPGQIGAGQRARYDFPSMGHLLHANGIIDIPDPDALKATLLEYAVIHGNAFAHPQLGVVTSNWTQLY